MGSDNEEGEDGVFHDEVEIEDFEYDEETETFTYPCPCGDLFTITKEDLLNGEDVARCPSCSLIVRVIFEPEAIENLCEAKLMERSSAIKTTPTPTVATPSPDSIKK